MEYTTDNGSAQAGSDYATATGTVTFNPGEVAQTVPVAITVDTIVEPDEAFSVNLSNPSNATILVPQATGTITNDDSLGSIGDFVWLDANSNGTLDSGEGGLGGVTVELTKTGSVGTLTRITDSSGHYLFTDLEAGDYQVHFLAPGYTPMDVTTNVPLGAGQSNLDVDLRLVPMGSGSGSGSGWGSGSGVA